MSKFKVGDKVIYTTFDVDFDERGGITKTNKHKIKGIIKGIIGMLDGDTMYSVKFRGKDNNGSFISECQLKLDSTSDICFKCRGNVKTKENMLNEGMNFYSVNCISCGSILRYKQNGVEIKEKDIRIIR